MIVISSTAMNRPAEGAAVILPEELTTHVPSGGARTPAGSRLSVQLDGMTLPLAAWEPLAFCGKQTGMLLLHPSNGDASVPDGHTLRYLAEQVGTALFHVQLYGLACDESERNERQLGVIRRFGALLHSMGLETLLANLMDTSIEITGAEAGAIALWEDDDLHTRLEWGLTDAVLQKIRLTSGEQLALKALQAAEVVLVEHTPTDPKLDLTGLDTSLRSCMCLPLITQERHVGVITLVNPDSDALVAPTDVETVDTISALAAIAVENAMLLEDRIEKERMQEQLQIARTIQENLIPAFVPVVEGFDLSGWSTPCEETGGDYYDFLPRPDDRVTIVVGDVSGHGIGAALMMATARAFLRAVALNVDDVGPALTQLNRLIEPDMLDDQFMTMLLGVIDPADGTFQYTSAGHDGPLICRALDGSCRDLPSCGPPLGVVPDIEYEAHPTFRVEEGDVLLLGTDGVWEAENTAGERFGRARLHDIIRKHRRETAEQLNAAIASAVNGFCATAGPHDDMTAIVVKRVSRDGLAQG